MLYVFYFSNDSFSLYFTKVWIYMQGNFFLMFLHHRLIHADLKKKKRNKNELLAVTLESAIMCNSWGVLA